MCNDVVCIYCYMYIQGEEKLHAQNSSGVRRDQNKDLLSKNCMSEMRHCYATDRKNWFEIKQNHWRVLKKKNPFVFRANLEKILKRVARLHVP